MFDAEYNAYRVNFIREQYKYVWRHLIDPLRMSDRELAEKTAPEGSSLKTIDNLYRSINNWANGKSQLASNCVHRIIQYAISKDIRLEFEKMYENPGYTHHRYQYEKANRISIEQDVNRLTH